MIFATINYKGKYEDFHLPILLHLQENFERVDAGLQGDSWIWVYDGENKVAIDTFTSMNHQVKSEKVNPLIQKVISVLQEKFDVSIYTPPQPEPHE